MTPDLPLLLTYSLTKSTRRLTFDILQQHPSVTYMGEDDGPYFKFTASNDYEVISRSRMDIQTERLWLLGARQHAEPRSGTMVFPSDEKRDAAYTQFVLAIDEWAAASGGRAISTLAQQAQEMELVEKALREVEENLADDGFSEKGPYRSPIRVAIAQITKEPRT